MGEDTERVGMCLEGCKPVPKEVAVEDADAEKVLSLREDARRTLARYIISLSKNKTHELSFPLLYGVFVLEAVSQYLSQP